MACWAGPRERKEPEAKSLCVILGVCNGALGAFGVDFYVLEKDLE